MAKSTNSDNSTKARPIGHGKDPLAEGNTLVNPSNSTDETRYEVKERSDDVRKASENDDQQADEPAQQPNAPSTPATETPNSDETEQAEVAEGRKESDPLAEKANKVAA